MAQKCVIMTWQPRSDFYGSTLRFSKATSSSNTRKRPCSPPSCFLRVENSPAIKLKDFGFGKNVEDTYLIKGLIGCGSFANVREAIHKETGERFAVKTIQKRWKDGYLDDYLVARVQHEVDIYAHLGASLNIAYLYGAYETEDEVHMVMELCEGGQLCTRITEGGLQEDKAKWTIRQVIRSIAQCHAKNVVMRDVKPENFLFLDESEGAPLKAIDFGLADYCSKDDVLMERCGTPIYIAPEVLKRRYGQESDLWSAGVIAYQILTGRLPFAGEKAVTMEDVSGDNPRMTNKEIFRAVLYSDLDFDGSPWNHLSGDAADFVKKLLVRDVLERPTAEEVLAHPWLASDPESSRSGCFVRDSIIQRLQRFGTYGKLKQVALRQVAIFIALETNIFQDLLRVFFGMNTWGSGRLGRADVVALLRSNKFVLSEREIRQMMAQMECDANGDIEYIEWLTIMADWVQIQECPLWDEWVARAFNCFDTHSKGWLTSEDLTRMLCGNTRCECPDTVPAALRVADIDGDGGLSLPEFAALMKTDKHDKLEIFGARLRG
ncbi:hypothetical protein BSKO_11265 [Bryopsis sp. KO-2023]|nr:hypothetical protein BSKO_11265 [Bryopsis sp. KO-2023]